MNIIALLILVLPSKQRTNSWSEELTRQPIPLPGRAAVKLPLSIETPSKQNDFAARCSAPMVGKVKLCAER